MNSLSLGQAAPKVILALMILTSIAKSDDFRKARISLTLKDSPLSKSLKKLFSSAELQQHQLSYQFRNTTTDGEHPPPTRQEAKSPTNTMTLTDVPLDWALNQILDQAEVDGRWGGTTLHIWPKGPTIDRTITLTPNILKALNINIDSKDSKASPSSKLVQQIKDRFSFYGLDISDGTQPFLVGRALLISIPPIQEEILDAHLILWELGHQITPPTTTSSTKKNNEKARK